MICDFVLDLFRVTLWESLRHRFGCVSWAWFHTSISFICDPLRYIFASYFLFIIICSLFIFRGIGYHYSDTRVWVDFKHCDVPGHSPQVRPRDELRSPSVVRMSRYTPWLPQLATARSAWQRWDSYSFVGRTHSGRLEGVICLSISIYPLSFFFFYFPLWQKWKLLW